MKKALFMILAVVLCQSVSAQSFWKTDDCENFNLIQAGYRSDSGANGFFVGYKHGWNITGEKLPLYIEPGLELNYSAYTGVSPLLSDLNAKAVGLTAPIDFSYKFKAGDFSISPITGPTLGWKHSMYDYPVPEFGVAEKDWDTVSYTDDDFVFGWDFGARIAYKKVTLEYRYNKVINNCAAWNSHALGIGFTF